MAVRLRSNVDSHTCSADAIIRHLHKLVTRGPGDLEIAYAMSTGGYDAVKWAEGQGVLADLVSSESPERTSMVAASLWCKDATITAQQVLATQPDLLAKLGLPGAGCECCSP